MRDSTSRTQADLAARVAALESLCAELYQALGTVGAPVRVLDAASAAANGLPLPTRSLLPIAEADFDEVRARQDVIDRLREVLGTTAAKEFGRLGGQRTSRAKKAASRENGRLGGRPRKTA